MLRRSITMSLVVLVIGTLAFVFLMAQQNYQLMEKRYRSIKTYTGNILAQMRDGVITVDPAGKVTIFNARAAEILGVRSTEIEGRAVNDLVDGGAGMLKEIFAGSDGSVERSVVLPDDVRRIVEVSLSTIRDTAGTIESRSAVVRDLTEARRLERDMQRKNKLTAMGELASGVAHEIRNPLNAIAMIAQRFTREFTPRRGVKEFRTLTSVMQEETRRVNAIIRQFLAFARPRKVQLQQVHVPDLINHVASLFASQAQGKSVTFSASAEGAGTASLDPEQMKQALLNLLQNALDATPQGGRITLTAATVPGGIQFVVADTGVGMPGAVLENSFQSVLHDEAPWHRGWASRLPSKSLPSMAGQSMSPARKGRGRRFPSRFRSNHSGIMETQWTRSRRTRMIPDSQKSFMMNEPNVPIAQAPRAELDVNPETGLTHQEVESRRKAHGYNEVAEQKGHPVLKFLGKFWGVSAWMLELIMVLSAVLQKYSDLVVVSALLVVNAVLGFLQEHRAAGVVETLRRRLQVTARVLREASWQIIPARDLVPGDIIRVRPGDIIPADVKLLTGALSIDQSALTGESKDADKAPGEVLPSGSVVRQGEGNAAVMLTGAKTLFGRTTELVQKARPKLHIEAVVAKVVRWLFVIVGALLGVVIVMSLFRGVPVLEMAPLMLVLLMSAVPVALPVMFTVSMAVGSKELAKRGVLVTRLSAAEDAATMDVLCVDKTGTITMNQLAVTGVIPLEHATESDVLFAGALASQEANQDPIDLAFLVAAKDRHIYDGRPAVTPISFAPFDAKNRRTEAVVEESGQRLRVMKGAVRTVAQACGLQPPAIEALEARVSESALKGYRTLAVARGPETSVPALLGLVTLFDPPRPDARQLIATLHDLGVPVKMLTGDALAVASEIAVSVGLRNIRRVGELKAVSAQAGNKAVDVLAGTDGFAEVYPEDKFIVVQHLQAAGHVTGMTGDGVNDAPALRQAEVGIAVSTATDVAKGAASVVLTEPGLTNIVALVEQGRTIYQRILTWIINKISRTILKAAFVAIAFMVTGKFVVSAFAMLLLVFMTDFAKISLATDRVRPSRKPETWNIGGFVTVSAVLGVAMVAEALILLWIGWLHFGLATNDNALYTFSFLTLLYFAVFSIVSARERRWFWATMPSTLLLGAVAGGCARGHHPDVRGSPGTHAITLVADARNIRLCDGLVPGCERRREGHDG